MTTALHRPRWGWSAQWRRWYRRVFPAYTLFLLAATHLPAPELPGKGSDKVTHALVFALFTFLFWRFCETFRRPLPRGFALIAFVASSLFAAADEWTQQFVGRQTDILDWLADLAGIAIGAAVLHFAHASAETSEPRGSVPPPPAGGERRI